MRHRSRKSLERDSKLLAEAVPIMQGALAEITELRREAAFQTEAANRYALQLKVIYGENDKLRKSFELMGFQLFAQAERIAELQEELNDNEALLDAYERYGDVDDDA